MGIRDLTFLKLGSLGIFAGLWVSCTSDQGRLIEKDLSGYVIVSTVATAPSTGPGLLSLVSPDGAEVTTIGDFYSSAEFVTGLAYLGNNRIVLSVDGADRINQYNLTTGVMSSFAVNVNVTATPLRQMAITNDKSLFVVESNTNAVEKIDASGSRVGAPFIATTTGSCVLATPYGIAYDPINNQIAVISSPGGGAGRLSIYDASSGACVTHVTAAPLNAGAPVGIAYHSLAQKFIVSFNTIHAIYAFDLDGTNGTQIYLNSSIISSPRALATDTSGAIYVGSDGTDTVEKLSWSGTGSATRALAGPLVGPSINSQNPTSILVIQ
jgi:hypothetical protein